MSEQEKQKAAQELFDYISELSYEAILASWFVDIEYCLWKIMQEGGGAITRLMRMSTLSDV